MKDFYIDRPLYLKKITPFIDKNLIKFIVGQRRVGKSYLLYQIMGLIKRKNKRANIIYINKEKFEFDEIKDYKDLISHVELKLKKNNKNYLFIDEVQDIKGFEIALRNYYSKDYMDIYCTGSNEQILSGELATYLSGRYIEIKIFSLSYTEFLTFHKLENSNESLTKYLRIGGLPYLINLPDNEKVIFEYLENIFTTILYKDIIARHGIRNHYFLENLIKFLANNTGHLISAKKISDYLKSQNLKMSPQIVLDYLSYLAEAFLLFKVKRTDLTGKKIFEISEKYYFEDWGLKNAIVGIENFAIDQIIENVIFTHLKIAGYNVYIGLTGNKEVDFICEKRGEKMYIQATYLLSGKKAMEREFGNLLEIKDNYRKIVVSLDEYAPDNVKGIEHLHLRKFLYESVDA